MTEDERLASIISEAVQQALAEHQRKQAIKAENQRRADERAKQLMVGGTIKRR